MKAFVSFLHPQQSRLSSSFICSPRFNCRFSEAAHAGGRFQPRLLKEQKELLVLGSVGSGCAGSEPQMRRRRALRCRGSKEPQSERLCSGKATGEHCTNTDFSCGRLSCLIQAGLRDRTSLPSHGVSWPYPSLGAPRKNLNKPLPMAHPINPHYHLP